MPIFNLNSKYIRSVRKALKSEGVTGPWEIMPEEPGSPQQQLWVSDPSEAVYLRMALPYEAIKAAASQTENCTQVRPDSWRD